MRFENHRVVVTGGASGIGEATVRSLVAEGAGVVIADLQQDAAEALAAELGERAAAIATDVTLEADFEAAVALAVDRFGSMTGMVNNAGIVGAVGSILDTPIEAFDRTMAILSRAVFLGVKHVARTMVPNGGGAMVSVASTAGVIGGLGPHVYTMAKHGVVGLTKSAAAELAGKRVRVNAVAPGSTVTPMTSALVDNDEAEITRSITEASTLGFAAVPQDIANAILFALSDDSRYMTGQTLVIDAGQTSAGTVNPFFYQPADVLLHAGQRDSTNAVD